MSDFFRQTFDPTEHHVNASAVRQRLESGARDEEGRFRVKAGSSLLREKEEPTGEKGVSLAALERQVLAEKLARKAKRKQQQPCEPAEGKSARVEEAAPVDPPPPAAHGCWLQPGLVVRVLASDPPGLHRAKGVVRQLLEGGRHAQVELLEGGERHVLPDDCLETVLPAAGGRVAVVGGAHSGSLGELLGVDVDAFCARVALQDGTVLRLDYECVCKTEAQ